MKHLQNYVSEEIFSISNRINPVKVRIKRSSERVGLSGNCRFSTFGPFQGIRGTDFFLRFWAMANLRLSFDGRMALNFGLKQQSFLRKRRFGWHWDY